VYGLRTVAGAGPDPTALVFTGAKGKALRRSNLSQRVDWPRLVSTIGVAGLHFHDLRHAGNVWAAQTGVSTRDLMVRMGHDDMRAALTTNGLRERPLTGLRRASPTRSSTAAGHAEGTSNDWVKMQQPPMIDDQACELR
jgi:integrase